MKKKDRKPHKEPRANDHSAQGRPAYHTGSTTQGGPNFGQGSLQLGKDANKQGSEKNDGSNYDNEPDKKLE